MCEAVVESDTKAIGISELKKEQGLAACSFVRGNDVFRFATTGYSYGKSICFALLALVFDSVRRDTGSSVLSIHVSPYMIEQGAKFSIRGTIWTHNSKTLQGPHAHQ